MVSAIRRIWRYSSSRRKCLKEATACYVCKEAFLKPPGFRVQRLTADDGYIVLKDGLIVLRGPQKVCKAYVKACQKEFKRLNGPQADHVKGVGAAPKDWNGWDPYLKRMMGNKLKAICRACHQKKSNEERRKRKKK